MGAIALRKDLQIMGCSGSKDKKDAGDAPAAPVEKKAAATEEKKAEPKKDEKPKEDMNAKSAETMSADLRNMMQDYFNRYDLDGSCTINTKEELKQLCTNLVVKLDLELDVQEIDKLVEDAGDMSKNNWAFDEKNQAGQCFAYWFLDKFGEKHPGLAQWHFDDLSSEEDDVDPNAKHGGLPPGYIRRRARVWRQEVLQEGQCRWEKQRGH